MTKIFRIMADEPLGFCVGWAPSPALLDELDADVDEWELVEDDGSDGFVLFARGGTGNEVILREAEPTQEELDAGMVPVGPDMLVWRDEASLRKTLEE